MTATRDLIGIVLIAGFVTFMTGAVRWRMVYQGPVPGMLAAIQADRRRWIWIHVWMIIGVFVTTAGIAGFVAIPDTWFGLAAAGMAAVVYALGALVWLVALVFRLTVTLWAAERQEPDGFTAWHSWAGWLYAVHMVAAYVAFAVLGVALIASDDLPDWIGWVGLVHGIAWLAGLVGTRFAGPFNPPLFAHLYTGVLGVVLLVS